MHVDVSRMSVGGQPTRDGASDGAGRKHPVEFNVLQARRVEVHVAVDPRALVPDASMDTIVSVSLTLYAVAALWCDA